MGDMGQHTKNFLSKIKANFTWILGGVSLFYFGLAGLQQGGVAIDYYCSPTSPSFLWFKLKDYFLCPIYSFAVFIIGTSLVIFFAWFLIMLLMDIFSGKLRFLKIDKLWEIKDKTSKNNLLPHLNNYEPELLDGIVEGGLLREIVYRPYIAQVQFFNESKIQSENSIIKKVKAEINYFDEAMSPILSKIEGQWDAKPEWELPRDLAPTKTTFEGLGFSEVDFEPNKNRPHTLTLGVCHTAGNYSMYAVSAESFRYINLIKPAYEMKGKKKIYIQVVLHPAYSDSLERWFLLTRDTYKFWEIKSLPETPTPIQETISKSETAKKICDLAEKFRDWFEYIRVNPMADYEQVEVKQGKDLWIMRRDDAEKAFYELRNYFEPIKYQFDCRKEIEDSLQSLWELFLPYSNAVFMWVDQKRTHPTASQEGFIRIIFGEEADKTLKEVKNEVENIKTLLTPYIRGEK